MAFVDRGQVTLLMSKSESFDKEKIGKITKKRKSELKDSKKLPELPF